jgi:HEPN domain-containing protein
MGTEHNAAEASRWLQTALEDLETAGILLGHGRFAHACFHAQQAGEKALKALWYGRDGDPWGHSVQRLIDGMSELDPLLHRSLAPFSHDGALLDRLYIPTRYPNGLPDLTPGQAYFREDAVAAVDVALRLVREVQRHISCSGGL